MAERDEQFAIIPGRFAVIRNKSLVQQKAATSPSITQPGADAVGTDYSGDPEGGKPQPPEERKPGQSRVLDLAAQLLLVPWAGVLLALAIICIALALTSVYFLTADNLINTVALYFSWICIAGFGEGLVLIGGGLDLSVGSTMGLAGMVSALLLSMGYPLWVALAGGVGVGAAIGFVNGLVVTRIGLNPFIATLGTLGITRGISYGMVRGSTVPLPDSSDANAFGYLGNGTIAFVPVPVVIMLVVGAVLVIVMNNTTFGRRVYAIGGNENAARLLGLNVNRIKVILYIISGVLAALGGMLLTARAGTALPDAGTGYELQVIAAVVIGGTSLSGGSGTVPGILIGAALLGVIANGIVLLGVDGYWQQSITGLVIVLAATLDITRRRIQARQLR